MDFIDISQEIWPFFFFFFFLFLTPPKKELFDISRSQYSLLWEGRNDESKMRQSVKRRMSVFLRLNYATARIIGVYIYLVVRDMEQW